MQREYPAAPIVAVGAVVRKGNQVLLVQRGREPARGRWVIPGGAVELGESIEEAVLREIHEECGIQIVLGPVAAVVDRIERDGSGRVLYHYVIIDYFADYVAGELRPASDVIQARWVGSEDLAAYDLSPKSLELFRQVMTLSTKNA